MYTMDFLSEINNLILSYLYTCHTSFVLTYAHFSKVYIAAVLLVMEEWDSVHMQHGHHYPL